MFTFKIFIDRSWFFKLFRNVIGIVNGYIWIPWIACKFPWSFWSIRFESRLIRIFFIFRVILIYIWCCLFWAFIIIIISICILISLLNIIIFWRTGIVSVSLRINVSVSIFSFLECFIKADKSIIGMWEFVFVGVDT